MSASSPVWFPRFGDIPGVTYQPPAGINLSKLRRRGERPEVHRYSDLPPSLWWGDSSEAPAGAHALADIRKATTARVLTNLAETLELPGEPSDYHFAIQDVVTELKSRRRNDPSVFAEIERLAWLDLDLISALPETVTYEREGEKAYYAITSLPLLIDMYATEGALDDAIRVVAVADRFGQGTSTAAEKARARAAAVAAEDA